MTAVSCGLCGASYEYPSGVLVLVTCCRRCANRIAALCRATVCVTWPRRFYRAASTREEPER